MSGILAKLKNREKIAHERTATNEATRQALATFAGPVTRLAPGKARGKLLPKKKPATEADAILIRAGDERLTQDIVLGVIKRDPFRWRRLTRARKKTAESIRKQAERREKIAVGLELYRQAESKLIKKERT